MDSDRDFREQPPSSDAGADRALAEIRERFLAQAPRDPAGRLLLAAMLTLAGLWIGLFSWLGSYAYELSEGWAGRAAAKPPSLLVGQK